MRLGSNFDVIEYVSQFNNSFDNTRINGSIGSLKEVKNT